MHVAQAKTKIL